MNLRIDASSVPHSCAGVSRGREGGFSLLELLVALTVFMIASAATFTLFSRHQGLAARQTDLSSLNISLRNAVAQVQLDLINAGTGEIVGANIPSWPIGVTILNSSPGSSCYDSSTHTYTASCFDSLNIIAIDSGVPPMHPHESGTTCHSTTSSISFVDAPPGKTAAEAAAYFKEGDQVLFVTSDGSKMATAILSRDGHVTGGKAQIQHNPTAADGTNNPSDDPLGISVNPNNKLGTTFCTTDWVLKIAPISYYIDASDPTDPRLMRHVNGTVNVVTDQVVGFKVGASLWNGSETSTETYNYDASTYPNPYDYSLIRSVRISLIGRTPPSTDPSYTFRNPFDGGPYQIQGTSIVVNPRNLSMKAGGGK